MLPDAPKFKHELWAILQKRADEECATTHSLIKRIRHVRRHEGDVNSVGTVDGDVPDLRDEEHKTLIQIPLSEIPDLDYKRAQEILTRAYRDLYDSMTESLLRTVKDNAERVGNVMSCGGGPLTQDAYLEMMERVSMDPDDPGGFCFVANPAMAERFKQLREEWHHDPDFEKRLEELEFKKRAQWFGQESHRKLVD